MSSEQAVDKGMFIFAEPIKTQFGDVRFLTYMEFLTHSATLNVISMNSLHLYYYFKREVDNLPKKDKDDLLKGIEELKKISLHEIVTTTDNILEAYLSIFKLVLEEEYFNKVEDILENEDVFMGMRQLIMDMNFLTEDPVSENPEIQEYYEDRKRMKQKESNKQDASDIITSIVAGTSKSYEDVKNWTVIQVYAMYYRIGAFKNYDAQTLFATVSSDIKIESWSKNIDLFEKESVGIEYSAFNKQYGGLFD